jgi:hypothetical protein
VRLWRHVRATRIAGPSMGQIEHHRIGAFARRRPSAGFRCIRVAVGQLRHRGRHEPLSRTNPWRLPLLDFGLKNGPRKRLIYSGRDGYRKTIAIADVLQNAILKLTSFMTTPFVRLHHIWPTIRCP